MIRLKTSQLSEHVWRVKGPLPINVWIVAGSAGMTLIDTGIRLMAPGILSALDQVNAGPLVRVLLTHGHPDHVGGLARIVEDRGVPVFAHKTEIPYMEGKRAYPRRKKAKALVPADWVEPFTKQVEKEIRATTSLVVYTTPGHSPGHVAYYHEQDDVLIAGDLFTTRRGRLKHPPSFFTADMHQAVESGRVVDRLKPTILTVCHGKEIREPHRQFQEYYRRWSGAGGSNTSNSKTPK